MISFSFWTRHQYNYVFGSDWNFREKNKMTLRFDEYSPPCHGGGENGSDDLVNYVH